MEMERLIGNYPLSLSTKLYNKYYLLKINRNVYRLLFFADERLLEMMETFLFRTELLN